jgi:hypothetical protein
VASRSPSSYRSEENRICNRHFPHFLYCMIFLCLSKFCSVKATIDSWCVTVKHTSLRGCAIRRHFVMTVVRVHPWRTSWPVVLCISLAQFKSNVVWKSTVLCSDMSFLLHWKCIRIYRHAVTFSVIPVMVLASVFRCFCVYRKLSLFGLRYPRIILSIYREPCTVLYW